MWIIPKEVEAIMIQAENGPRLGSSDIYPVGSYLLQIIEDDFLGKYFDDDEYDAYVFLNLKGEGNKKYHRIYFYIGDKRRILKFFNECAKKYNTSFLFFLTALNLDKKFPKEWWAEYLWTNDWQIE